MTKQLGKFILKLIGWKITGSYPYEIDKKIILAAPHTSNWDFPIGILIRTQIGEPIKFIGKSALFKPPHGWLFSWLGGIPVDRTKSNNFVDATVQKIKETEKLTILISGEGSRKRVDKFKTGFYHMAHLSKVPIIPLILDGTKKEFRFEAPFYPTGDAAKEIPMIEKIFEGVSGIRKAKSFRT